MKLHDLTPTLYRDQRLVENEIFDKTFYDQVFEYFQNITDWSGTEGERVWEDYLSDLGRDEDDASQEEFLEWLQDEVERRSMDVLQDIQQQIVNNQLYLRRAISVNEPEEWIKNPKEPLGVYWSYGRPEAAWGGHTAYDLILTGMVPVKGVSWVETLAQNIHPSFEQEKEVRLQQGTPVRIVDLQLSYKNGQRTEEIDPKELGKNPMKA